MNPEIKSSIRAKYAIKDKITRLENELKELRALVIRDEFKRGERVYVGEDWAIILSIFTDGRVEVALKYYTDDPEIKVVAFNEIRKTGL